MSTKVALKILLNEYVCSRNRLHLISVIHNHRGGLSYCGLYDGWYKVNEKQDPTKQICATCFKALEGRWPEHLQNPAIIPK